MATSAARPNPWNAWHERQRRYKQQRKFAFSATRSLRSTLEETEEALNLLRSLRREKSTLYSLAYEEFLKEHRLDQSLHSLKLMFLDIEAGFKQPVIPQDETTVFILIDEINCRQQSQRKKRRWTSSQPTPADAPPKTTPPHAPPKPTPAHAAPPPIPLATDFTFNDMIKHNIEALQFYMTTQMTMEDYMKFIFTKKDIEAKFHRYINNILVHKTEGHKYLTARRTH